ncbi:type IV secretion system DNA-binding domain-containing protein [Simkania negevensis]|uniref:Conjugal transfer protein TraD n=1 Tax=Simkania negevensis (strain ATCC VR-1471 / DSM 27360 / Z) TaxID=331113 RepID=F8L2X3_SIMNZ|nr:type IV secretion system DNA-binding domain-containing protein [Simkania negevensis]CCB87819.1 conjugal transfer protein TraD [Simkania negevensis Z]
MGLFKTIAAGGQTWAHRIRMLRQVVKIGFLVAIVPALIYLGWFLYSQPTENYKAFYYYGVAKTSFEEKVVVDAQSWKEIQKPIMKNSNKSISRTQHIVSVTLLNERFKNNTVRIKKEKVISVCQKRISTFLQEALEAAATSGKIFLTSFLLCMGFFLWRGRQTEKKKHISGLPYQKSWKLKLSFHLKRKASDLKLASVPLPKSKDPYHILMTGSSRTGKTNCLRQLLQQIRERGDCAVVVDTTGSFISEFYRDGKDVILNPCDVRSKGWHPWCDCADLDFEKLAYTFIPEPIRKSDNDFFIKSSRSIFIASLERAYAQKNFYIQDFLDDLMRSSTDLLYKKLRDTDAAIYVDPKGERTPASVRATLNTYINHLRPLKNTTNPFSIKDWIFSKDRNWLFLASYPTKREKLNVLLSVWFSLALSAVMERGISQKNKLVWLVVDELHSLQKLEYLRSYMDEISKYQGCITLATQNLAQLDEIYGESTTDGILDQCGISVCFRQNNADIAKRMSNYFGKVQTREIQEGISYGANEIRDGVSLSSIEKIRASISETEILSLNNLEAFLRLPGNISPTKIKFDYLKEKHIAESYIEDPKILADKKEYLQQMHNT